MNHSIASIVFVAAWVFYTGCNAVLAKQAVTEEGNSQRDVYVGYDYEKEGCKEYLEQLQIRIENNGEGSINHMLRNALLPVLVQAPIKTYSTTLDIKGWKKPYEMTAQLIDKTFVDFPRTMTTLSNASGPSAPLLGEFRWLKHIEVDDIKLPMGVDSTTFRDNIRMVPCVAFAEFSTLRSINLPPPVDTYSFQRQQLRSGEHHVPGGSSEVTPNDPYFSEYQWYAQSLNLPAAWYRWTGPAADNLDNMSGVIAVTDTGCDVSHPDMEGRFWKNSKEVCGNGVDDDNNGYIDDCDGWNFFNDNNDLEEVTKHGTSVSSAVTDTTNNNVALAGTCWTCRVMCLRVGVTAMHIGAFAEAVNYAKGYGVKIVNFSAGGGASSLEEQVIEQASKADVVVVVAAGNSACDLDGGDSCSNYGYPAKYALDNILSVGATTRNDTLASFTNVGATSVDAFAPGSAVYLATVPDYKYISGTSFSSPFTAGVLGLVRSKYPELNYKEAIASIVDSCRAVSGFKGKSRCPGIVDANGALEHASKLSAERNGPPSFAPKFNPYLPWYPYPVPSYPVPVYPPPVRPYIPRNPCWPFDCSPFIAKKP